MSSATDLLISSGAAAGADPPEEEVAADLSTPDIVAEPTVETLSEHRLIARLAYRYWQERGCPEGSPELDWFRAEREIRGVGATPVVLPE